MIVLDTHVFLWFILNDPRIQSEFKHRLEDDPSVVHVPSVCLWEAMVLVDKGRLSIQGDSPGSILRQQIQNCGFAEAPLTGEIAVLSRTLKFGHQDPADRFIAATAYAMNAKLATSDASLRKLDWIELAY